MGTYLLAGTAIGAIVGFFHMLYIFSARFGRPGLNPYKTLWQGVWTWGLWTLFGAYVLTFWIFGLLCMGISKVLHRHRDAT